MLNKIRRLIIKLTNKRAYCILRKLDKLKAQIEYGRRRHDKISHLVREYKYLRAYFELAMVHKIKE